jgi:UDP:flavonoid glycosyltransferase YjiC (YdhE family)
VSRITMIGFGTRGDVQPFLALGKGLKASGHQVRIASSANSKPWIEQHGLEAAASDVDVQALMATGRGLDWAEHGNDPLRQLRVMKRLFAEIGMDMIHDAWKAAQDADVVITSFTSDPYGVSIAEKLGIKQISALMQPALVATRDGRSIAGGAPIPNGESVINYLVSKLIVEPLPWRLVGQSANRFRQEVLGMPSQTLAENSAARRRLLTLHGYSPHAVPRAADWPSSFHVIGYWFLDEQTGWQPPPDLLRFLEAGSPPVYVGFGSMTGRDPEGLTQLVVEAIQQSDQRAVLLSGWVGLGRQALPDSIFCLEAAPHNWLFPRMAAVVHHGGAGTTGEGLRAGVPTVIIPHLGDQLFWGHRVATLGVGPQPVPRPKLTAKRLAAAIHTAVNDQLMRQRVASLGEKIRAERGVETAVKLINQALDTTSS